MSSASLLRSFSPSAMPGPVLPMDVDMAVRFYVSHSPPPLRGFLGSYETPLRRSKRERAAAAMAAAAALRPCLQRGAAPHEAWGARGQKKKVVFADSKGMSLTAVRVFSKNEEERVGGVGTGEELQFHMSDLENAAAAAAELKIRPPVGLALDFKQPSADYLDFRRRLLRDSVCLENCSLQGRSLAGTVKVRNVGFQKSVLLRATFDSWANFVDVDCSFMNNVYGAHDTDTFAFALELPAEVAPHHRVEFCVRFRVPDRTYWDNNDGKNYALKHAGCWEKLGGGQCHGQVAAVAAANLLPEMDQDQLGSPRLCGGAAGGFFPGWQSWNRAVPYW
ncbi:protein phosphatase 1 regulatory subunit 3C-B [Stigmatopora nigra]